ncbi:Hemagglutinin/hemolysin-related protein [Chondromyces apiculatus DSM 436]|uniref:Hemagglutinin/hemolysin-related protein n=2 Tax=Chondromyces apiculatus TaxID=51 RepID=A0A017T0K2_9BACT|nr:Hemagglutinin/hemolysin-related protein [Chondromyces apiculatus DSM 436]
MAPLVALGACLDNGLNTEAGGAGGAGSTGPGGAGGAGGSGASAPEARDPATCDEAAEMKTHMGCDFWPTVIANPVWSVFDFGVGVANVTEEPAEVIVTRGDQEVLSAIIDPHSASTLYLPWVQTLKGEDWNEYTDLTLPTQSVRAPDGAYHLVSSRPVSVYQLNAVQPSPEAGPEGKDWASCPSTFLDCLSYSNEATLLLPSTSMTGSYRITSYSGSTEVLTSPYLAITATEPETVVDIHLGSGAHIIAGEQITATNPGESTSLTLQQGEVAEIFGTQTSDFSGSTVSASKPVQIIAGIPCSRIPFEALGCNHLEEVVLPVETLGSHYLVPVPTGPIGLQTRHAVRLYGHVDNTELTYPGTIPPNAPVSLAAGQVVDLGLVEDNFEVSGNQPFGVSTFLLAASTVNPNGGTGGPAHSNVVPLEQFRARQSFFTPSGYDAIYLSIVTPRETTLSLDGVPINSEPERISDDFNVVRVPISPGQGSMHVVEASRDVSVQVIGYATRVAYHYPAAMNLARINDPIPSGN